MDEWTSDQKKREIGLSTVETRNSLTGALLNWKAGRVEIRTFSLFLSFFEKGVS